MYGNLMFNKHYKFQNLFIKQKKLFCIFSDPFTLCLDIIDKEVGFQATDKSSKMLKYKCSGEYLLIIIVL